MAILAFSIAVGPEIVKTINNFLVEWMRRRNGCKVRLKVGDVEAEAQSEEELGAIVKMINEIRKPTD